MNRAVLSLLVGLACGLPLALLACGDPAASDPIAPSAPGPGAAEPDVPGDPSAPPEAAPGPSKPSEPSWVERSPHISLMLIGNQQGLLKPCGCSEPQLGGLERLATLVEMCRKRAGEGFAAFSLGWSLSDRGEAQAEAKAGLYRAALELLDFKVLLLGTTDLFVPALAQPYLDGPPRDQPSPPANAPPADTGPLACAVFSQPFLLDGIPVRDLRVRALSVVSPDAAPRLRGVVREVFPAAGTMGGIRPRPDGLWIVSTDASAHTIEGLMVAMRRLGPSVIVDWGGTVGSERIENASLADGPFVLALANLGKEVGILDLDPPPAEGEGSWSLSYHTVALEPWLDDVPSHRRQQMSSLIEAYRQEVRSRDYLVNFDTYPAPDGIGYVGSSRCALCHPGIYGEWLRTPHAQALRTLRTKGSDWDPECVRCHVVGFQRLGERRWGRIESGFADPVRTPHLGGVGCESCHGPGAAHVESPSDRSLWGLGGPNWRDPGRRGCEVCHDLENSHRFSEHYLDEYRPQVDHHGVPRHRRVVDPDER